MKSTVYVVSLLCLAAAAHGKCPYARYSVAGSVLLPPGVPAKSVRVYLLVDGMGRASDYPATAADPDFEIPGSDGKFRVEARVSTASGDPDSVRERCQRAEAGGEIFVTGDGIYARRVRVSFTPARRQILKQLEATALVGPVEIERLPEK